MLEIREQPRLPLKRQVEICVDGIHHRLLRSALTLAVVSLAVAFLANVLAEVVVVDRLRKWSSEVQARASAVDRLLDLLMQPATPATRLAQLSGSHDGDPVDELLRCSLAQSHEQWRETRRQARQVEMARRWLEELSPGPRRMLIAARSVDEAFVWLQSPNAVAELRHAAQAMPHLRPGSGVWSHLDDLGQYHFDLTQMTQRLDAWLLAWRADEQAMHATWALRSDAETQPQREAWSSALRRHAMDLPDAWVDQVLHGARQRREVSALMASLHDSQMRVAIGGSPDASAAQMLTRIASDAELAARAGVRIGERFDFNADQVRSLAGQVVRVQRAGDVATRIVAQYGRESGFRGAALWLVLVSMLVCVVGVTNAMLISVLERFREIATMKCLGGLDRFIASLFLMEAAMLGTLGGVIGAVLGLAIGLSRMAWMFGRAAVTDLPWLALLGALAAAAVAGVVLTALSAVYPAVRAATLPPMEAMRVG